MSAHDPMMKSISILTVFQFDSRIRKNILLLVLTVSFCCGGRFAVSDVVSEVRGGWIPSNSFAPTELTID